LEVLLFVTDHESSSAFIARSSLQTSIVSMMAECKLESRGARSRGRDPSIDTRALAVATRHLAAYGCEAMGVVAVAFTHPSAVQVRGQVRSLAKAVFHARLAAEMDRYGGSAARRLQGALPPTPPFGRRRFSLGLTPSQREDRPIGLLRNSTTSN
jgi:hypothetical protein